MLLTGLLEIKGFGGVELLWRKDKHGINQRAKPWKYPSASALTLQHCCRKSLSLTKEQRLAQVPSLPPFDSMDSSLAA